ncbi:hypothetical protein FQV26_08785 [Planococcus sp. CPCC 101016]|uniref:collagenase n=1 Tax=Planococcus sp. CPCC 101016 TaxID=2599617 RepID=UPI0011B7D4B2|nr:collagenase [Planococcus sp. CPCC 101016]TWT07891.1 hypothetical protein FQV26_08785 [Planococcus sp. CPCC 101016]
MKSIFKRIFSLVLFSYLAYFLILNQGLVGGFMIAGMFLITCMVLFIASIMGIIKGSLKFMKLQNVGEAVGLMVYSILLTFVVILVGVINSFVVYTTGDPHQSKNDKVRLFASTLFQVSSQAELLKTEKNGVTYFYSEKNKDEISKMNEVLQREREIFNSFLGTNDEGGLTIEFHEDYDSLEAGYGAEEVAGYYNLGNKSIHLVPTDESWELILVHEYSHYQSHLFSNQHGLSITRIPSWFEEGIADYFAEESNFWYDLESVELIDFHDLDSQQEFDNAATDVYDPYTQSFLAVQSLVEAHGKDIIPELLKSRSTDAFYKKLEAMIDMEIEEYKDLFLEEMIAEQNQMMEMLDLAYEQLDKKEYEGVQKTVAEIKKVGDIYDIDAAEWILVDAQLDQGNFEEAAGLLNRKIEEGTEEFLIEDLFFLAEIYLLIDPQLSLEAALKAEKANQNNEYYFYEEDLVTIYKKINSPDSKAGYRQLLRDEWIYNSYVLKNLTDKLSKEYPGDF